MELASFSKDKSFDHVYNFPHFSFGTWNRQPRRETLFGSGLNARFYYLSHRMKQKFPFLVSWSEFLVGQTVIFCTIISTFVRSSDIKQCEFYLSQQICRKHFDLTNFVACGKYNLITTSYWLLVLISL